MRKSMILSLGIAIFTMLFGAGNIVFPLVLGREVGNQLWFAIIGLFITAIFIPLLGLVITLLFEGNYKKFLGTMGKIPGAIAALIIMILIGPFGATARCITLAHTAVSWYMPSCSLVIFSALAAIGIYALTVRQGQVIDLLGKTLGPIKLMLLFSLVAAGLFVPIALEPSGMSATESFCRGFKDGCFTLDLFCAIFFAGLVYSAITRYFTSKGINITPKKVAYTGTKACLIGALLLGLVYLSFSLLAARHSVHVRDVLDDHLLNALSGAILGSKAGIMASSMELIACITTAMALVSVFAEYLRNELFNKRLHYKYSLLITVSIMFAMSNLGFSGIMTFIEPIVLVCYPALIAFTIANIIYKVFEFNIIKLLVYTTFVGTLLLNYGHLIIRLFN